MMEDQVRDDFERARQKAAIHDLLAAVNRRPNDLVPFHEIRKRLSPEGESYRGLQTVPIDQIVGSMDRFEDFDRTFLPRKKNTRGRWTNVDRAFYHDVRLPPIQLYKVGDIYFVKDGNHRVSVARERGVEFIDAEVIEGHVRVPLTSHDVDHRTVAAGRVRRVPAPHRSRPAAAGPRYPAHRAGPLRCDLGAHRGSPGVAVGDLASPGHGA